VECCSCAECGGIGEREIDGGESSWLRRAELEEIVLRLLGDGGGYCSSHCEFMVGGSGAEASVCSET